MLPMESPYTARMAEAVKALAEASVSASPDGVEAALAAIEHRVADLEPRRDPPFGDIVAVFVRDRWSCRYCGSHTIALPVLLALSLLHPNRFPHHPNWKAGRIHPAYLLLSTSLDHVRPRARGGSWNECSNLVAACWPCNSGKADFTLDINALASDMLPSRRAVCAAARRPSTQSLSSARSAVCLAPTPPRYLPAPGDRVVFSGGDEYVTSRFSGAWPSARDGRPRWLITA